VADILTPEARSERMRRIGPKNTKPEMVVRRFLWRMGYRYRLHVRALPGRPDIALMGRRKAIFVHGCFWHGHHCRAGRLPRSRAEFWRTKIEQNRERDDRKERQLCDAGWDVLTIWQCELRDRESLERRLVDFLSRSAPVIPNPA
jgi:DNA mismatch endonuclease (patch repair protein)